MRFWAKDSDTVRSAFLVRESNVGIRLVFNIVDKDVLLAKERAVILSWYRDHLAHIILVLCDATPYQYRNQQQNELKKGREALGENRRRTLGLTSSITDCFRLSRLIAFFAGVLATTLSSLSPYPPNCANSSALLNFTYTPYFFIIRCMLLPPTPIMRLWYDSGTWKEISAGSSSCRRVSP